MKILVAMANYGMKNVEYAKQLIQEYRSMPFDVDIVVLSEAPKDYGNDVKVLVGLPSKDPWSLPFSHRRLFAENINDYDIFIYTEDDTLIRKDNILAFIRATNALGDKFVPGFIRYELYPNGKKNYLDIHGHYHWLPNSVEKSGEYIFATLSNKHSACYVLTQGQLQKAIRSGGFLVPPHSGRYDLICSAGTDPYTQCGLKKVICLSHLQEFELHHLPDAYLNNTGLIVDNGAGLDEEGYRLQIKALLDVADQKRATEELFITEKPLSTPVWDKDYYEPCRYDILRFIPFEAKDILSVGCGWGVTEAHLIEQGKRVTAIPLDSIISKLAEEKGVNVLPADFSTAFDALVGSSFDAIVLSDVLQHLPDPIEILTKLRELLKVHGVLVGNIPNLGLNRRLFGQLFAKNKKRFHINNRFDSTNLNLTSAATTKKWLKVSNLHPLEMQYEDYATFSPLSVLSPHMPGSIAASNIVFLAERFNE